jgi:ribosome-binding factor A
MKPKRTDRLGREIQRQLGEIFLEITRDYPEFRDKFLSVTAVRMTPDLLEARAYISIYPSNNAQEVLEQIKAMKSEIRYKLGQRMSHIKRIPDLKFFLDDTLDYLERIDYLLNKDKQKDQN